MMVMHKTTNQQFCIWNLWEVCKHRQVMLMFVCAGISMKHISSLLHIIAVGGEARGTKRKHDDEEEDAWSACTNMQRQHILVLLHKSWCTISINCCRTKNLYRVQWRQLDCMKWLSILGSCFSTFWYVFICCVIRSWKLKS